jgi:hypothetical protein
MFKINLLIINRKNFILHITLLSIYEKSQKHFFLAGKKNHVILLTHFLNLFGNICCSVIMLVS